MKRLLAIFTLLLLLVSCSKEAGVSLEGEMSSERVSFTASVVDMSGTRATLINSWSGGEEVALFEGETLYLYTIAADGTMSGDDVIVDREQSITYTAFYPYDSALSTIEEYEAACTAGEVDYMSATTTTSGSAVELQFEHQMVALTFTVWIEDAITSPAISLTLDGNFSSAVALEVDATIGYVASRFVANYFVEDDTDLSSAMIKVEQSGSVTILSIKLDDSNILKAGEQYSFLYTIGDVSMDSTLGFGTEDNPYIISSADDMRKVGSSIDNWDLSSHYILVCDINLEGIEFTPIGTSDNMFTGSLDGDGYSITGSEKGQGLFKYVSGATIKNLKVGGTVTNSSGDAAGLIIGYAKNSTLVTNCETLEGSSVTNSGENYTAGIVAHNDGATITNCINRASISGTRYTSGIVAYNDGGTVSNCYNTGSVEVGTSYYTAGVVAYNNDGTVSNCYNTGSIKGGYYYTGGVVGHSSGYSSVVSYCYNTGSISYSYAGSVGGVVGGSRYSTISYCYYDSDVVTGVSGAVDNNDSGTTYCGLSTEMMKGDAETNGTLLYYFTQGGTSEWTADTEGINNGYPVLKTKTDND
ncbi:MAG: hypothetical protein SNH73_06665 [Rikenellaceae bacterium]